MGVNFELICTSMSYSSLRQSPTRSLFSMAYTRHLNLSYCIIKTALLFLSSETRQLAGRIQRQTRRKTSEFPDKVGETQSWISSRAQTNNRRAINNGTASLLHHPLWQVSRMLLHKTMSMQASSYQRVRPDFERICYDICICISPQVR